MLRLSYQMLNVTRTVNRIGGRKLRSKQYYGKLLTSALTDSLGLGGLRGRLSHNAGNSVNKVGV
jgi:hypothetical protein